MKKFTTWVLIAGAVIIVPIAAFRLYAQFALDYSLESLRHSLETSQGKSGSTVDQFLSRRSLESLAMQELVEKKGDLETVVLLEHAARSVKGPEEKAGNARAEIYLTEIFKDKSTERNAALRFSDTVYRISGSVAASIQSYWNYFRGGVQDKPVATPMVGTIALILGEAERMESSGKLEEAERYYKEFLDRYPDREERGFVKTSLANVLIKMRRFDDARDILETVRREFPGTREETFAYTLLSRIDSIHKREAKLSSLEDLIKQKPEQILQEGGGLELALGYIDTYQLEKALLVLKKLEESPDPRLRTKALFYQGWIYKKRGDLSRGKEIFQILSQESGLQEKMAMAVSAELAEIHTEMKEYGKALSYYQDMAVKAAKESMKALSELEQSQIYLFGLGNAEAARASLQRLNAVLPQLTSDFEVVRKRLEEAFQKGLAEQGFGALAQGRIEAALNHFKDYLKKFPRDGSVHAALASVYLLRGELEKALEEAQTGFGYKQDEYTASILAYVYEKTGNFEEARKYNAISIQIKPSYLTGKFNLAWVDIMLGNYQEADQLLAELESAGPRPPAPLTRAKILNNRGCALWALGKKKEATEKFSLAAEAVPDFGEARKNITMALRGEKPVPVSIKA